MAASNSVTAALPTDRRGDAAVSIEDGRLFNNCRMGQDAATEEKNCVEMPARLYEF